MTKADKKKETETKEEIQNNNKVEEKKEETAEDKLVIVQDKLLRTMAEMENQRRRFEKEKQEAFEFGGFNFARESLSLLDNVDRAIISFKNDDTLKNNKDIDKFIYTFYSFNAIFPFKAPIKFDMDNFGGIFTTRWTWSICTFNSTTMQPSCWQYT